MSSDGSDQVLPPPGTTVRRETARVLPVDARGRVLLLHGWDPARPAAPFWFTIGGAVEPGEDLAGAAVRELWEETGLQVAVEALRGPFGSRVHSFSWGQRDIVQRETYFALRAPGLEVSFERMDDIERQTTDRSGWWRPDDLDVDGAVASPWLTDTMREAVRIFADGGA